MQEMKDVELFCLNIIKVKFLNRIFVMHIFIFVHDLLIWIYVCT